jgi:deazaflavin-dependent oxidoreductase (nitroreductase family)
MYDYNEAGAIRRLIRRTAATPLMTWLYLRIQQQADQFVYGLTCGRTTLSSLLSGLPVVMLTTVGAKTGQSRTLPVLGLPDGERIVLIASNYGQRRNPSWYYNLRKNPRASVSVEGVTYEVEARELTGEERERYFQQGVEMYPGFAVYRRRAAGRRIPVIKLDPAS